MATEIASAPAQKMQTEIPPDITMPDSIETWLGTLRFSDGLPDTATVEEVYDNLDRMRGVDVFLNTLAAASLRANIEGVKSGGCDNYGAVIHENRVDGQDPAADAEYTDDNPPGVHGLERWSDGG